MSENIKTLSLYEAFIKGANNSLNEPCVLFFKKTFNYKYVIEKIERTAILLNKYGIKKGDIITLVLPNIPQTAYIIYAANKIGAVVHLIHALSTDIQLKNNLEKTKSKFVFAMNTNVGKLVHICKTYDAMIFSVSPVGELGKIKMGIFNKIKKVKKNCSVIDFDKSLRKVKTMNYIDYIDRDKKATTFMFNGSGTNGVSNTIELSDFAINSLADNTLKILETDCIHKKYMSCFLPLFHPFGFVMCMHAINYFGGCCVFIPQFSRKEIVKYIKIKKLNYLVGVPSVFYGLLAYPKFKGKILQNLEISFVGGDTVPLSLLDNFNELMVANKSKCRLLEGYGPSETCSATCVNTLSINRRGTCGKPLNCTKYRIYDENNKTLRLSGLGELYIGGDSLFNGYFANKEANSECIYTDEKGKKYLKSGDIVEINKDGYVTFKSRKKRVIKVSGFSIFPNEIEQVAILFGGINKACAIGVPDSITMSKIVLFYESCNIIDKTELHSILKKHLEPKAVPSELYCIEKMPITPYNKIDFIELRKLYDCKNFT